MHKKSSTFHAICGLAAHTNARLCSWSCHVSVWLTGGGEGVVTDQTPHCWDVICSSQAALAELECVETHAGYSETWWQCQAAALSQVPPPPAWPPRLLPRPWPSHCRRQQAGHVATRSPNPNNGRVQVTCSTSARDPIYVTPTAWQVDVTCRVWPTSWTEQDWQQTLTLTVWPEPYIRQK